MCWHDLKKFCCCFSIKQGAWIVSVIHTLILILVLVESMLLPDYSAKSPWLHEIVRNVRLENPTTHKIFIGILLGAGIFYNLLFIFGLAIGWPWFMLPCLMSQMLMVFGLFFLSVFTYIKHWSEANLFYAGVIPGVAGFVFLYFWIVNMVAFNILRREKMKITVTEVSPEDVQETTLTNNYMLPSISNTGNVYEVDFNASFNSGFHPPIFQITAPSTPRNEDS